MHQIGLEYLSVFGLEPIDYVGLGAELGCDFVSLNLAGAANRLPQYPPMVLRDDAQLRRDLTDAITTAGLRLALLEGFAITSDTSASDLKRDLDMAAEMGAAAICVISLERDRPRSYSEFAKTAEMAADRGLVATTEVGAGIIRTFTAGIQAVEAVNHASFKLLIDTMHFFRKGGTIEQLSSLDPKHIGHIQLNNTIQPGE